MSKSSEPDVLKRLDLFDFLRDLDHVPLTNAGDTARQTLFDIVQSARTNPGALSLEPDWFHADAMRLATDPLFLAPLISDAPALVESRQSMRQMSVEQWLNGVVRENVGLDHSIAAMGMLSMLLARRIMAVACSTAERAADVPMHLAALLYRELGENVAKTEVVALAFAAAVATVSSRLGLNGLCQWATGLLHRFVPIGLRQLHASAGDERFGSELIDQLQRHLGERIATYQYQLVWRRKQATSVLSNILRMLISGGESRSGLPPKEARESGEALLAASGSDESMRTYRHLLFDHFACTAILRDATEPFDYERLAEAVRIDGAWNAISVESTPRQAYHRRLFMILEHAASRRRVELLIKSRDAFLVGRAYQWTAKGGQLCADAGPWRDGQFDWHEAANRIGRHGSIVAALAQECHQGYSADLR